MQHANAATRRYDMTDNMTVTVELDRLSPLDSHPYRVQIAQWIQQDNGDMLCNRRIQFFYVDSIQANDKYHRLCDRVETVMAQSTIILRSVRLPHPGTAEPHFEE